MVSIEWRSGTTPARKTWLSKLASAFQKSSKRENAQKEAVQEYVPVSRQENAVVIAQPTKRFMQIGVPLLQQQCLLFSLPIELRQTIYQYVFGPSLIHIESLGDRLAHVKCKKWESSDGWDEHTHCQRGEVTGTIIVDNSEDPNDQLLAFRLTCRRMYVS